MAITKAKRAEAALERVRSAGRLARREAKQRTAVLTGGAITGVMGYLDANKPGTCQLGPVHASLLGIPMAFATAFSRGSAAKFVEQVAGPLLGVATYRIGNRGSVLGDEYGDVAGEYDD